MPQIVEARKTLQTPLLQSNSTQIQKSIPEADALTQSQPIVKSPMSWDLAVTIDRTRDAELADPKFERRRFDAEKCRRAARSAAGHAASAEHAAPLYIRDKVAQTSDERAAR